MFYNVNEAKIKTAGQALPLTRRRKPLERKGLSARTALAVGLTGLVGLLGMWAATSYDFGSARQIGPAVFPFGLSLLLTLAAVGIVVDDILGEKATGKARIARPDVIAGVLGGPLAFAILVEPFGLAPAIFACVIIAALAERSLRPVAVLGLAAVMALVCSLVFVSFLKLPIDIVNW